MRGWLAFPAKHLWLRHKTAAAKTRSDDDQDILLQPQAQKHDKHVQPETSDLSHIDIKISRKAHGIMWTILMIARLLAIAVFITAITLGSRHKVFALQARKVLGNNVDTDSQLAILGLFNKIMDLIVTKALQGFAGLLITMTMIKDSVFLIRCQGPRLTDLSFAEELINPVKSISALWERGSLRGWKRAGWWRFILALAASSCVLLQGTAFNTLAWPKPRWYPDPCCPIKVEHPVPQFISGGLDWMNYWNGAWGLAGSGAHSWYVRDILVTAQTILALAGLRSAMMAYPPGWRAVGGASNIVAIDTRYTGAQSQGLAMQQQVNVDIFNYLKKHRVSHAKDAVGWTGNMTLEIPSVVVGCGNYSPSTESSTSVQVFTIPDELTDETTFGVSIAPLPSGSIDQFPEAFSGADCNVTFRRVRFPFAFWIVDSAATAEISPNQYDQDFTTSPRPMPHQPIDTVMARSLSQQLEATVARIGSDSNDGMNASQLLLATARNLQTYRSEYSASDAAAFAPVIVLLATQLLASAAWNVSYSSAYTVHSSPIRWQLFGSGPRLAWEWAAAIVLAGLLAAVFISLVFSLWYRFMPGPWLELGGMLIAANRSPPIASLAQSGDVKLDKVRLQLEVLERDSRKAKLSDRRPLPGLEVDPKKEYLYADL